MELTLLLLKLLVIMMAIGMILNLAKLKLDFNEHHREILIKEIVDVSNKAIILKG